VDENLTMAGTGTYVYCLVAAARRPTIRRTVSGPAGLGPVRLVDLARGQWLAVSDAPLNRFGEDAINTRLSDLDWVSRAAVRHEAVIESFIGAPAVLPMKLFTIFTDDQRAVAHVRGDRRRVDGVLRRVRHHHEWGVRVVLDRAAAGRAPGRDGKRQAAGDAASGIGYLSRKKAQRDAATELARHAQDTVADLYDRLAAGARDAKRRAGADFPVPNAPLLLDAAFLVPVSRAKRFRASAAREARALARYGYRVTLTGPWPPYTFIQE
jgi:hypothetical protein